MKNDAYQRKRKVKDQWSETEYVVVHQVTDGVPAYEVKDESGNVKTIHHNQLFLGPPQKRQSHPWEQVHQFKKKMLFGPPVQNIPC